MSTRAYKVIEIKTEKTPTFNLSEEYWLCNYTCRETDEFISFDRDQVEDYIKYEKNAMRKSILKLILADFGEIDTEIDYYIY